MLLRRGTRRLTQNPHPRLCARSRRNSARNFRPPMWPGAPGLSRVVLLQKQSVTVSPSAGSGNYEPTSTAASPIQSAAYGTSRVVSTKPQVAHFRRAMLLMRGDASDSMRLRAEDTPASPRAGPVDHHPTVEGVQCVLRWRSLRARRAAHWRTELGARQLHRQKRGSGNNRRKLLL